ncbi:hypothetical protein LOTGIDRAFT_202174 [Lottia gigantea]|uniref:Amino acid permease/ SLC12A domain-containing protein n=1 Tax=Lottia gigantea TaxID=225164 RepID=V4C430_LOTGI|nr:hypothetical protein LOTGIDRAFT_202174 [Lottia gigantea]ESO96319.1 hypothetical protein LOTGIDRAFT_202174 [Lottia gigantea]
MPLFRKRSKENQTVTLNKFDNRNGHTNPVFTTDSSLSITETGATPDSLRQESSSNGEPPSGNSPPVTIQPKAPQLKQTLSLVHCAAIMIAVTGHSSVFIAPTSILKSAGSPGAAIIVWLVGGLINMGLALCFAELGTMFPTAGGPYAFVMKGLGPLPGFLIMYGYVVLISGPFWAFLSYTAALYLVKPVFPDCENESMNLGVKLLAGWIMITLVAANCVYMKYVRRLQTFLSSTKIFALLIIVIGGIYELARGETEYLESPFEGTSEEPGGIAIAIFYSIFSYGGWQIMTTLTEEVKRPERDLPRSVYIAFPIVIIKYILTNIAYFTVISPRELLGSTAVALLFMDRLYKPITALISVFVALTSIGALNASIMGHSRLLFAGARVGHMPVILGMIHTKYLTPWPAIFLLLGWSLAMLYTGGLTTMIEFISLFSTIMGIAVVITLLYLRYKQPQQSRPYKTFIIIPIIELLVNIAVLVLAIYQKPHKIGIGLAILFAGIPLYWFGVLWRNKPKEFKDLVEFWTVSAQKVLVLVKGT